MGTFDRRAGRRHRLRGAGPPSAGRVASRPRITALIIGATRPQHIDEAVAALDLVLTDAELKQLETAYEPHDPAGF
jgi:hypothetical protein